MNSYLVRLSLSCASLLALGACTATAAPPLQGTFAGPAVTPLPSPPLPPGDLNIDAVLRLDASASTFELDMDLEAMGLTDVMDVRGTYVAANGMLTLTPTRFEIDPASTNTATLEDGVHCITLAGFVGTVVCLPEQTNEYTKVGDALTFSLEHDIAGVSGSTPMALTRTP